MLEQRQCYTPFSSWTCWLPIKLISDTMTLVYAIAQLKDFLPQTDPDAFGAPISRAINWCLVIGTRLSLDWTDAQVVYDANDAKSTVRLRWVIVMQSYQVYKSFCLEWIRWPCEEEEASHSFFLRLTDITPSP